MWDRGRLDRYQDFRLPAAFIWIEAALEDDIPLLALRDITVEGAPDYFLACCIGRRYSSLE
jgi:hypothetical protein